LVGFIDFAQSNILQVFLVSRYLIGQSLFDDLSELMVVLPKNEYSLQSDLERILHDILHDFTACLVQFWSVAVYHSSEILDPSQQ
jgi:hypothetical protein